MMTLPEVHERMTNKITVLVTGSDGFVGRHLVPYLADRGYKVIAASRKVAAFKNLNVVTIPLPDLSAVCDWQPLLRQCDAVVHLAGIAHTLARDELYDRVNHRATKALALAAFRNGVHLIFTSSIAAQTGSYSDRELTEEDTPRPDNAYGKSKLAAERAIQATGTLHTILRPVVIYGEGAKGNFGAMERVSSLPIPLPFGGLTAKRSVLSIQNYCSAVVTVLSDPRARGETFIVSDPTPLTIAEVFNRCITDQTRSPWLISIPQKILEFLLKAVGQESLWQRIGRPLVAHPKKLLALGWRPS